MDNILKVGPREATKLAYPMATEKSQKEIASQNLTNPVIVHSIAKEAELIGLTKKSCIEKIKEGLEATRLFGKDAVEHPDHSTRLRAAELGLKLHGELKESSSTIVNGDAIQFVKSFFKAEDDSIRNPEKLKS